MTSKIPGVLLAGGLARRMGGGDKPMRTIAGRTILERVIARLSPQCDGLILNANNHDLGETEVVISAGVDCAGVNSGDAVQRCTVITPTINSGRDAFATFYYWNSETPYDQDCEQMAVYRWDGSWNNRQRLDSTYGNGGRLCTSQPWSIRVKDLSDFSPFVLSAAPHPTTIYLPLILNNS